MARGTIHAPKPDDQRRRRNAPANGERELTPDGVTRGPELAELTDAEFSPAVVAWFDTWRNSPQAQVFEATDWQRLGMLAYLVADFLISPDTKLMAEIRQNEERLGATYTDRQRARMRITAPALATATQPGLASVTQLDDARARWAAEADEDD